MSASPLAVLLFTPRGGEITGSARWSAMRMLRPFAARFDVRLVNRPVGLPATITMPELAQVYAERFAAAFEGPVPVLAISTGGSIALQLAADHPALVDRLVLGGTARTLGPLGRRAQRAYMTRALDGRRPSPALADIVTTSPLGRLLLRPLLWLSDGARGDRTDAVAVLHAEDGFDLGAGLGGISAPTLLIQGAKDLVYPLELARETVDGIPRARLVVYENRGHNATFTDRRFARDALAFLCR
ncbi:alpha/beta fold hydrolase [Nonomuraea sp. bgisy101]|uniref:alpha/beta fold hydrolase n=1 Tax=Nonomuraea sp. bgisy101 TaxID=3413784 RepID=UPI003D73B035